MRLFLSFCIITLTALHAMEINFTKKFTAGVMPRTVVTHLVIESKADSEAEVTETLSRVSIFVNGYQQISKKGGQYKVSPNYRYEEGKRTREGFIGRLRYEISSQDMDTVNMFLDDLLDQKGKEQITINNLGYTVSKKRYNETLEKLRFQGIIWGISYAKELSSKIYKECSVKDISFTPKVPRPRMASLQVENKALSKDFAPKPIQSEETITLTPSFTLECK